MEFVILFFVIYVLFYTDFNTIPQAAQTIEQVIYSANSIEVKFSNLSTKVINDKGIGIKSNMSFNETILYITSRRRPKSMVNTTNTTTILSF